MAKIVLFAAGLMGGGFSHVAALSIDRHSREMGYPRINFAPDGGGGGGTLTLQELESQVKAMGKTVTETTAELKDKATTVLQSIERHGGTTKEAKDIADKALLAANNATTALQSLETQFARLRESGNAAEERKSPGQQVVESEKFKEFMSKGGKGKFRQIVTSLTTDAAGSAGAGVPKDRLTGIQRNAVERPRIRDLLLPGRTSSNTIEYAKEKVFTNAAAIQAAEGDPKGESTIQLELATAPVRTLAHFLKASTQILDDAPGLMSLIDYRLRWGLDIVEDRQLLNGTGAGVQLSGLIQNSTAYFSAFTVEAEQSIDIIRKAMLQAVLAEWPATGIIMHHQDWARIELTKDAEERYIIGNPQRLGPPTLWGLPIVESQAMGITKFMVGAFIPAAQIFDRQDTSVEISTEDDDNFQRNLVTIRAEKRLTLIVYRDEALIYGDFGEVS